MADVLKQTLYWSGDPTFSINDVFGTGGTQTRAITAAESHDANDNTYEGVSVGGDGFGQDGTVVGTAHRAIDTASVTGAISFLRITCRGRCTGNGGQTGTWYPIWAGLVGGGVLFTASFADGIAQQATHPSSGLAWTNASINATTFGVQLQADFADSFMPGSAQLRMSEWKLEVWGPGAVDVTAPATGAESLGEAAASAEYGGGMASTSEQQDPTAVVQQGTTLNQTSNGVTIRSAKSSLQDQTTATRDIFTSPASWPNSGTQLQPLYAPGSQGVQGDPAVGGGIQGSGPISGIKLFALVRVAKHPTASTITNIRFGTGMGVKALEQTPTIRDITQPLTEDMWETVNSVLITTGATAQPFEWGNGTNSVWAQLFGWTFNHQYSNTATPQTTSVEVAEAWIEVYGVAGSDGAPLTLVHALNLPQKTQKPQSTYP